VDRCHAVEALATRQGILVTIGFYVWGAFHYLLASFGLARRLETARAARLSSALAQS